MTTQEIRKPALRPEVLLGHGKPSDSVDARVHQLQQLADLMDTAFELPGTGIRFGLDALIGLVPGLGDTITSLVALYIVGAASRLGVSRVTMTRMVANVAIDWLIGIVPLFGDFFDVYWKANQRNVGILRNHLAGSAADRRRGKRADWLTMLALVTLVACVLAGGIFFIALAAKAVGFVFGF
jgi:hypothetical protein